MCDDKFWSKVNKHGPYPEAYCISLWPEIEDIRCHVWIGYINPDGYGGTSVQGKIDAAHRLRWMDKHGEIPKGKCILHKCDNRACVRLSHLFLGTRKTNKQDCIAKGRHARGDTSGKSKLCEQHIRQIRKMYASGKYFQTQLGLMFRIDRSVISRIVRNEAWQHV